MVKPVKFTRDSGCPARDEFLVISEGSLRTGFPFPNYSDLLRSSKPGACSQAIVKGIIYVDTHSCNFLLLGTVLHFHFICRPMLVHRMTLVSFQLFRKNLGNLQEFFGQMVHRPPGKKLPVCLCTRHIGKGAVGEMRHILLVHVKHHTKRGVQFAIARDHLRDELTLCH